MRLRQLIPLILLCGTIPVVGAVEAWEVDNHFMTVVQLIDRNLRLPAQRQMKAFDEAAYPQASLLMKGLRFYYAKRFRNLSPVPAERATLDAEVKSLEAELKGQMDKLPQVVKTLLENDNGQIDDLSSLLLSRINPDAPPPKIKITDSESREIVDLVQGLIEAADAQLDAAMAEIKAETGEFDDSTPEGMERIKQATFRRYKFANVLYAAYKVMREVVLRTDAYGLDPVKTREVIERWMHTRLQKCADKLADWEWVYAPYYPFLKHRLNVLLGEIIRLNQTRPVLPKIKISSSLTDIKDAMLDTASINSADYKGADVINAIEILKQQTWADLLQWMLLLGDTKSVDLGLEMFEKDYLSRAYALSVSGNPALEAATGHVHLVAQQLYHARGNNARRDELLSQLNASKNFFAPNASLWIQYYIGDPQGGTYEKPPVAVVSRLGMSMAARLWLRGKEEVDEEKAGAIKLESLVQMRNALKGLPPAGSPEFCEIAPELYQSYAYYLFNRGWFHQAVLVARDGLCRCAPYWKTPKDNRWIDRSGALSRPGITLTKLAGNLLTYVITLRARAPGAAVDGYFNEAVDLLKRYDPASADDMGIYVITIHLNNDEFDQALCVLDDYQRDHADKRFWCLGMRAMILYRKFAKLQVVNGLDHPATKEAITATNKAMDAAWTEIEPIAQGRGPKVPEEQAKEARKQYRTLIGIKVSILFLQGKYAEVLKDLNADFWKEPPDDIEMNNRLLLHMANAIYKIVKDDKAANRLDDPQRFLANWQQYVFVKSVFADRLEALPELMDDTVAHRRAMGQVFHAARRQAANFATLMQSKDPRTTARFEGIAAGTFETIGQEAMTAYAEVMERIIDESSDPLVIISVADALWDLGQKPRAGELYEIYRKTLDDNEEVTRFRRNPKNYLDQAKEVFSVRTELKSFFEGRGSLIDLLLDDEDFLRKVYGVGRPPDEWTEDKADYGAAFTKLTALKAAYEPIRRRVTDPEGMGKTLAALETLVHGLASSLKVNSRLVEVYRDQGGEKMNAAIELSKGLYQYDPRSILYRSFIIESTIQALTEPPFPSDQTVKESRMVALEIRKDCANNPRFVKEYWIAVCQILEMSAYLKDLETINTTLLNNRSQSKSPIYDLCVAGSSPLEARDQSDVEICSRFLKIYDLHGITDSRPYRIETGSDGVTYFLEGNMLVEDAVKARAEAIRKAQAAAARTTPPPPATSPAEGAPPPPATPPAEGTPPPAAPAPPPADAPVTTPVTPPADAGMKE